MNKRVDKVNVSRVHEWKRHVKAHWQVYTMSSMAAATLLVVAYRVARADGATWTLPYYGSTSTTDSSQAAFYAVNTGSGFGVHGQSTSSIGVLGDGLSVGVQGNFNGTSGAGVFGNGAAATGVLGSSSSGSAYGVYGVNNATSGSSVGTAGISSSSSGYGVYGSAPGAGTGVYGTSANGRGVNGVATNGGTGVYGPALVILAMALLEPRPHHSQPRLWSIRQ